MRLLYTVQRYGPEIVGGSEAACRMFAERLAARGHDVEVVTSCARRYTDWADEYTPGTVVTNGVTVHRLPVASPRTTEVFGPLNDWTIHGPWPVPLFQQQRWTRVMGPELIGYRRWMTANASTFDAVIHMTYMYGSTTSGISVAAGRVPTILQPTAHDEPAIWVRNYDTLFRLADAFLFFTPEERDIVRRRFGFEPAGSVTGIGLEIMDRQDPTEVRGRFGIGDDPYLVYVGRIDPAKGAVEAWRFFDEYKRRNPSRLKFVVVGDPVVDLPSCDDLIVAGFLDEADKRAVLAGSLALLQPSYFESFSIVLCEAWMQSRPAVVQGASDVLRGQALRSSGALPYRGFAQFEAAVSLLERDPALADRLGANGRA
ncbi:MAG: glycosyltransferase family 4 protein, partial [Candidatus Limnocylindrales bacterium]